MTRFRPTTVVRHGECHNLCVADLGLRHAKSQRAPLNPPELARPMGAVDVSRRVSACGGRVACHLPAVRRRRQGVV